MSVDTVCRPSVALARTLGCVQCGAACVRVSRVRVQASSRCRNTAVASFVMQKGGLTGWGDRGRMAREGEMD